jgi:uncharacterized protein YuzE
MKLHYYPETDSLYINLSDGSSVESQEIRPGVVLDFDAQGKLVGIDLDHASDHVGLSTLEIEDLPARITSRAGDAA